MFNNYQNIIGWVKPTDDLKEFHYEKNIYSFTFFIAAISLLFAMGTLQQWYKWRDC
jgi:hypothetical protein